MLDTKRQVIRDMANNLKNLTLSSFHFDRFLAGILKKTELVTSLIHFSKDYINSV